MSEYIFLSDNEYYSCGIVKKDKGGNVKWKAFYFEKEDEDSDIPFELRATKKEAIADLEDKLLQIMDKLEEQLEGCEPEEYD